MSNNETPISLSAGDVVGNIRMRRNRQTEWSRRLVRENVLTTNDLIWPIFIVAGENVEQAVPSMPGVFRYSIDNAVKQVQRASALGIPAIALFPYTDPNLRDETGSEALNNNNLVCNACRAIKEAVDDVGVITDVALDPYTSHGHDGLMQGETIINDETVDVLVRQALNQASAGADVIAPSDMMDGRIGAIRECLDLAGFHKVSILAYTAKYASAYYGPFRDALDSAPKAGDKKTYQMDPANSREALRELELDEDEGADIVMVKPAGAYLDIIRLLREHSALPIAAYQVSGEYAMIKAACEKGWLDEKAIVLESLLSIRRAGADLIFTYFARQAARWLK